MTEDYVEEDNIIFILTDYSNWLATTDIPKYFGENLKSIEEQHNWYVISY